MSDMQKKTKAKKEPLFVITKRAEMSFGKGLLIRIAALAAALIVCGIVTLILTKINPLVIFKTIVNGAVGNETRILETVYQTSILLIISVAVTPAFKMKFWNIGAEGQVIVGGLATAVTMYYVGNAFASMLPAAADGSSVVLPAGLHILLIVIMAVAAIGAGALWGIIPAIFKSRWKTNETLFTLMMNYVAIQLTEAVRVTINKGGSGKVDSMILVHGWFPKLFGKEYLLDIIIVLAITAVIYVYLKYSKHGYEISVVGESENTAKYVGINVKKVIIRTMALSGAICGLAGLLIVGGASHSLDKNMAGGRGFTAIMVSWLSKFNPIVMIFSSLFLIFLERGAKEVASAPGIGLNESFSEILTGILLFFIIGCEFFINYRITFRKHIKEVPAQ